MKRPRSTAAAATEVGEVGEQEGKPAEAQELFRVCSIVDQQIINGHVLPIGTMIELTEAEIDTQRAGGVALEDVHAEDKRDVYSVREPYAVPDSSE